MNAFQPGCRCRLYPFIEDRVDNTDAVTPDIIIDYDDKGNVIGIEILSASEIVDVHELTVQSFEIVMVNKIAAA